MGTRRGIWTTGNDSCETKRICTRGLKKNAQETTDVRWLRLVGSLKLQVSFAKEPYKRDDILQKRLTILRSLLIVATPYQYTAQIRLVFLYLLLLTAPRTKQRWTRGVAPHKKTSTCHRMSQLRVRCHALIACGQIVCLLSRTRTRCVPMCLCVCVSVCLCIFVFLCPCE